MVIWVSGAEDNPVLLSLSFLRIGILRSHKRIVS